MLTIVFARSAQGGGQGTRDVVARGQREVAEGSLVHKKMVRQKCSQTKATPNIFGMREKSDKKKKKMF